MKRLRTIPGMTSLIISSSSVVEARRAEGRGEPFESAWRLPSTGRVHCCLQYFRQSSYENKPLVAGKSEIGQGLGPITYGLSMCVWKNRKELDKMLR